MKYLTTALLLLFAGLCPLILTNCGIIGVGVYLPAAVAQNATFTFNGTVVDGANRSLNGVLVTLNNTHHVWTPIEGAADQDHSLTRRVDGTFSFEARGSYLEFVFRKDGFYDANYRFNADNPHEVTSAYGVWPKAERFPVVLLSNQQPDANLAHFNASITYENYPIADCIALNNVASDGRTGDITYSGKDAEDATLFSPGVLYLTLQKEAPPALNAKGDIDPNELDLPHHITLHLPGLHSGFIRIEPRIGYYPLATCDTAPATGYLHELAFTRARLKEMRIAKTDHIIDAHEYFYFIANGRYGKGAISWSTRTGKPAFQYELLLQPQPDNRDLTSRKVHGCG